MAVATISILLLHHRQAPSIGGPFDLIEATSGREVSDRDFRGKWLLVFFGYTHCPDICPTTLGAIAEAMSELGPLAQRVQPLFITIDPERDTPQILVDYISVFDSRITALTGSSAQMEAAAKAYRISYAKRVVGDDYYMDHTSVTDVMRPDGSYSSTFLSTDGASEMAARLRKLMKND